jgi:hypothetical protein
MSYDMHAVLARCSTAGAGRVPAGPRARDDLRRRAHRGHPGGRHRQPARADQGRAGQPPRFGGIIYAESAEKVAYFIERCDRQGIPLLFVQDVSGFMVGPEAEHEGIIRAGARFVEAMATARVPKLVLTTNHAGRRLLRDGGAGLRSRFHLLLADRAHGRDGGGERGAGGARPALIERAKREGQPLDAATHAAVDAMRADYEHQLDARYRRRARLRRRHRLSGGDARGARLGAARRPAEPRAAHRALRAPTPSRRGIDEQGRPRRLRPGLLGRLARGAPAPGRGRTVDYLMLDYLAEVTMSILQKQKERDPAMGYARDFIGAMESVLPAVLERGVAWSPTPAA